MAVNPNDMTAYRKKKQRRNFIYKILAFSLILFGILLIWFNAETIFEPLRGIGSKIGTKTSSSVGFPVKLPGSATYSLSKFGTNFTLLTDTYLYTYTSDGSQVYALPHGYSNPVQKTSDRRILLYNQNAHEFSLYNKTSQLYKIELDEKIVSASLGANDTVAVITTSTLYSNILYIYDGNGKWKYTKRFGDEKINSVIFGSQSDEIYIATTNVMDGDIASYVYRLKYDRKDDQVWKYTLPSNSLALLISEGASGVNIICDNMLVSLSVEGTLLGSYSFNTGTLQKPVLGWDFTVLVLSDYVTGKTSLVSFDSTAAMISIKDDIDTIKKVEISNGLVYTLEGHELIAYDKFLEITNSKSLDEEFENFVRVDNKILLLGYEEVVCVEF